MTEEVKDTTIQESPEVEVNITPTIEVEGDYTEFEQEQMKLGWDPKGEKSAKEWASSYPLYKELTTRGKEISQLKRTVDHMKKLMERQEQAAYQRALDDLQLEKKMAIQRGNIEEVQAIEHQQQNLRKPTIEDSEELFEIDAFKEKHQSWLNGTSYQELKMAEVCHAKDAELATRNLPAAQHLKILESYMMGEFPEYFGDGSSRPRAQAVEGSKSNSMSKETKKYRFADLSQEQKEAARLFEKRKIMSVEDYIKELVKVGDLK